MHDREIALRNARMRIYFDANLWEMNLEENSFSMLNMVSGDQQLLAYVEPLFLQDIDSPIQRIVWDAATCGGSLNYKHDEPTSFFSSLFSFHFFSSRRACLALW